MRSFAALLLAFCTAAPASGQPMKDPLAPHQWRHRVLLLYVPAPDDPALQRLDERIAVRQCGIEDRDLVVGRIVGKGGGQLGGQRLGVAATASLRRAHDVPLDRVVTILVGKDGGAKMRAEGVADLDAVFQRIDGMPMRQREMAERGPSGCREP